MLMAELTTAVQHNLPVKIIVLKNNSLTEVSSSKSGLVILHSGATSPRSTSSPLPAHAALKDAVASGPRRCGRQFRRP